MIDLWPDGLSAVDQRSPLTVLKEQASLLGEKTQNIVIAVLEDVNTLGPWSLKKYPFKYEFLLTCPALGHYRFRLFSIGYDIDIYPVRFALDSDVAGEIFEDFEETHEEPGMDILLLASNEEEFSKILKRIFSSRKTVQVIRALLSQANS
jgi:hypothetical protein